MAKRFRRENFLFPYDLRDNNIDIAARPVDAYERASEGVIEQAPQRPFEVNRPDQNNNLLQLGRSLGALSDSFSEVNQKQYADYSKRAESAGAALAAEDELAGNKRSFKKAISQTRVERGDQAARELMGMSPHLKRGYDQTRARSAALSYNATIQSAYADNPAITDDPDGPRLQDIDQDNPEFLKWLQTFDSQFITENGLDTLDPTAYAAFVPAQQDAQNRVALAHSEVRSARKLMDFQNETAEFVDTVVYDLNGNREFALGTDGDAMQLAANLITNQLDEANALGYGGDDLQGLYDLVVEGIIADAVAAGNPALLEVIGLIEVGPKDNRRLLVQTAKGGQYQNVIDSAANRIIDREHTLSQRERQVRDQQKEDNLSESIENIALTAGLYQNLGRSAEGYAALQETMNAERARAAEFGYTAELIPWSTTLSRKV